MRVLLLALGTTALTALVVSNAYYKKEQFYPTLVYLLNSNRSLGVLYLQSFVMLYLVCTLLKKIFFGTLRAAEVEHLIESSWFAVLETFILLAAFHQELNISFVSMVSVLFVLKSFHWLAGDRIDYMERSPIISFTFHLRAVTLLLFLGTMDYLFIRSAWTSLITKGPSVEIVFGLEYAIMLLNAINTLLRYVLHTIDLQSEDPWENKTIYMRCVDIILGFFKLIIYVSYMTFMLYVLFIPLHIARRLYITAKNFQKSIFDVVSSHQAIRNLNTLYPDATPDDLDSANNVCIICREEMVTRCKKLPCNHIFHMACLRSWFQRQQTCPTCRMDVLSQTVLSQLNQAQARRQQQQQQQQQNPPQGEGAVPQQEGQGVRPPPMVFPMMWPGMVPPQQQQQQQQQQQGNQDAGDNTQVPPTNQGEGGATQARLPGDGQSTANLLNPQQQQGNDGGGTANGSGGQRSGIPPFSFPPFMGPPLNFMGPPFGMMPPFGGMPNRDAMQNLTEEQLHALEGMERSNVEARIELLRNIQRLLDSAVTQLNQYSAVMATLGPAGPGFPGFPRAPDFNNLTGLNTDSDSSATPAGNTQSSSRSKPSVGARDSGLLDTQQSFTSSTAKLSELKPSFTFKAASLDSAGENDDEQKDNGASFSIGKTKLDSESGDKLEPELSEIVRSKLSPDSSVTEEHVEQVDSYSKHADVELRHRRLQRFNSLPANIEQAASNTIHSAKDSVVGESLKESDQGVHRTVDTLRSGEQDKEQN